MVFNLGDRSLDNLDEFNASDNELLMTCEKLEYDMEDKEDNNNTLENKPSTSFKSRFGIPVSDSEIATSSRKR